MDLLKDYYSTLQVHEDAEQDIIDTTYKKLCKKYHPDICSLPGAEERMKEINTAYDVLGDPVKRKQYNVECKRRSLSQKNRSTWFGPGSPSSEEVPRETLSGYMLCLSSGLFHDAFNMISEADKKYITLEKFVAWQRLVATVYHVENFKLRYGKQIKELLVDGNKFANSYRFDVELLEQNKLSDTKRSYIMKKFVVLEGSAWHIYLGYKDLTEFMNEFQYLVSSQNSPEMMGEWKNYRSKIDGSTNLFNRKGLLEHCASDVYRYERYDLGFYVAVIQVKTLLTSDDYNSIAGVSMRAGQCIKNALRCGDTVASIGPGRFACVFLKVNRKSCKPALVRMAERINKDCMNALDIQVSVYSSFSEYGGEGLENAIAACERKLQNDLY